MSPVPVRGVEEGLHAATAHGGLYLLLRSSNATTTLARHLDPVFEWRPVAPDFPLFLLRGGDYREVATDISCHQDIAGDSALSLGMLARFQPILEASPWRYRQLFWETGVIGQVLYLEAEAHGLRGTGIGCFFDDEVHDLLGLRDHRYQSLYHFTIGVPLEDARLMTLPPYHHLNRAADRI